MSNQEMANHIHDILSKKAAMGMGYRKRGRTRSLGRGELEDIMEIYGRGVMVGGRGPKKGSKKAKESATNNSWIQFIRKYAKDNHILYKDALKSKKACVAYRRDYLGLKPKEFPCNRKKTGSKTTKKKCPKGEKLVRTKGYTKKSGKRVKPYHRCIAEGYEY
jgi:hypothetical protein